MTRPAISLGLTAAPVVTIPARQARAFRVIDNRTSELTSWDTDLLPDALAGLDDLDVFSFDDVLPLAAMDGKTDPDDIPEPPKNPVTRTGNLWVLGKHRIIYGDSCDQQTVERLLDGAAPDLMVTDRVYPGFPTLFWGLSGFFVNDLMGKALWSSWKTRSVFQGAVGAFCASTAPSASTGPICMRQDRRVLGLQSTRE